MQISIDIFFWAIIICKQQNLRIFLFYSVSNELLSNMEIINKYK